MHSGKRFIFISSRFSKKMDMRIKARVKGLEKLEVPGVTVANLESEQGDFKLTLEVPSNLLMVSVKDEVFVQLSKEEPKDLPDDALLMRGHLFKIVRDAQQIMLYVSIGGYQLRAYISYPLQEEVHDLNYMDTIYISIIK